MSFTNLDIYTPAVAGDNLDIYEGYKSIDLRRELQDILFGSSVESAKGHKIILRRMRKTNGNKIACDCVDSITHEPDKDYYCQNCRGLGYLFDEELVTTYRMSVRWMRNASTAITQMGLGEVDPDMMAYFFEYTVAPTIDDYIVTIELDAAGKPTIPYKRTEIIKPHNVYAHRLDDGGRVEFYVIYTTEDSVISTWRGGGWEL